MDPSVPDHMQFLKNRDNPWILILQIDLSTLIIDIMYGEVIKSIYSEALHGNTPHGQKLHCACALMFPHFCTWIWYIMKNRHTRNCKLISCVSRNHKDVIRTYNGECLSKNTHKKFVIFPPQACSIWRRNLRGLWLQEDVPPSWLYPRGQQRNMVELTLMSSSATV